MDAEKFDSMVRTVGASMSRRGLMGAIGAIAGTLVGVHARRSVEAGNCSSDMDCPGFVCCNGLCSSDSCCGPYDTTHCWAGTACVGGVCVPETCSDDLGCYDPTRICCLGHCVTQECCGGGDDIHCLSGYYCATNCPAYSPCCLPWPCADDSQCVTGICCNGDCIEVECCGDGDTFHCPSGYYCEAMCRGGSCCLPLPCADDSQCVTGICCNGECVEGECCGNGDTIHCASGYYCEALCQGNAPCCLALPCADDSECVNGLCCDGACFDVDCCGDWHCGPVGFCENRVCIPKYFCTDSSDCPIGTCCWGICQMMDCCFLDNAGCDPSEICVDELNPHCVPPPPQYDCCALGPGVPCPTGFCCPASPDSAKGCAAGVCNPMEGANGGWCCVATGSPCVEGISCCNGEPCTSGICGGTEQTTPAPTTTPAPSLFGSGQLRHGATIYIRRPDDDDESDVQTGFVPVFEQADFDRLASAGAGFVLLSAPAPHSQEAPYLIETSVLDHLTLLVGMASKAGLGVVISLRTGPGRPERSVYANSVCRAGGCMTDGENRESDYLPGPMWTDTAAQQAWVSTWTTVVKHFSNESAVIGYHLLGLPDPPNVATYQGFLAAVATAIRTAGVGLPLLVSAPADGLPSDLAEFEPLNDDSTVYLITTFAPYRYLLQSLDAEGKLTYGGPFELQRDGESGQFDQTWFGFLLDPAFSWAATHNVPLAIGAFGMPRWQPGLQGYLHDLLDIFSQKQLTTMLWQWLPAEGADDNDAFNLEHGPDPGQHDIVANSLMETVIAFWGQEDSARRTGSS